MASEQVALIFKLVDESSKAIEANNKKIAQLEKTINKTNKKVGEFENGISNLGKKARNAVVGYLTLTKAIGESRKIIEAGTAFERINQQLLFVTGNAAAAAKEMGFIDAEVNRLQLDLLASASGFGKLSAAAKGTELQGQATRDIFTGIAEASTVLRLTSEQTQGALTAIEQIISKGTVSAEELRGQLGERLPGAFQIAARSMSVTTEELGKLLQQGAVASSDFLPKFAAELRKTFAGDAVKSVDSAQGKINEFNNTLLRLRNEAAKSGLLDAFTDSLEEFSDFFKENQDGIIQGVTAITKAVAILATGTLQVVDGWGKLAALAKQGLTASSEQEIDFVSKKLNAMYDLIQKREAELKSGTDKSFFGLIESELTDAEKKSQKTILTELKSQAVDLEEQLLSLHGVSKTVESAFTKPIKNIPAPTIIEPYQQPSLEGVKGFFSSNVARQRQNREARKKDRQEAEKDIQELATNMQYSFSASINAVLEGQSWTVFADNMKAALTNAASDALAEAALKQATSSTGSALGGAAALGGVGLLIGGIASLFEKDNKPIETAAEKMEKAAEELRKTVELLEASGQEGTAITTSLAGKQETLAAAEAEKLRLESLTGTSGVVARLVGIPAIEAQIKDLTTSLSTETLSAANQILPALENFGTSAEVAASKLTIAQNQVSALSLKYGKSAEDIKAIVSTARISLSEQLAIIESAEVGSVAYNNALAEVTATLGEGSSELLIDAVNISDSFQIIGDSATDAVNNITSSVQSLGDIAQKQQGFIDQNLGLIENSTDTVARLQSRFAQETAIAESLRQDLGTAGVDDQAELYAALVKAEENVLTSGQNLIEAANTAFASSQQGQDIIADVVQTVDANQNALLTTQETLLNTQNGYLIEIRDAILLQNDVLSQVAVI